MAQVIGTSTDGKAAVLGESTSPVAPAGPGVHGRSAAAGVFGESTTSSGVAGHSVTGWGVEGRSDKATGVAGFSKEWIGVYGETADITHGAAGVWGEHKGAGSGVKAISKDGPALFAHSETNESIHADTKSPDTAAIAAYNSNPEGTGAAIFAKKEGSRGHAGFFDGNVYVSGTLSVEKDVMLANADCAEDFDVIDPRTAESGSVMVLTDDTRLAACSSAYDKRVAGVVSGAGAYKPGIVLDRPQQSERRKPIALMGKVYCRVDTGYGAIAVGDLLTTSPTTGHAMKAAEPAKAFGAVIGKALRPLASGRGLIPVLIALQ